MEPSPLTYFAHQWPRHDGDDIKRTTIKYARPLENYEELKTYYPIPYHYFHDLARKDFWSSFVRVYGETGQALHLGQLASGVQVSTVGTSQRWKWLPPPSHAPALPLNVSSQDSIIAHTIQTRRIQNQNLAITALTTTRGALSDWRAKFLSKKEKHEWYETQREREEMGVEGPFPRTRHAPQISPPTRELTLQTPPSLSSRPCPPTIPTPKTNLAMNQTFHTNRPPLMLLLNGMSISTDRCATCASF